MEKLALLCDQEHITLVQVDAIGAVDRAEIGQFEGVNRCSLMRTMCLLHPAKTTVISRWSPPCGQYWILSTVWILCVRA